MIRLSSHGAAKQVTGSCHLVETESSRVLIDCGLFQGGHELAEENAEEFGFDASTIDVLLLTHAHLDHCGRIPLLVKRGFRGRIIATAPTRELTRLVLADSAGLQEEEARRAERHARHRGDEQQLPPLPLYTLAEAFRSMDQPIEVPREKLGIHPGRDCLSIQKSFVLAHIGQIRSHQSDFHSAQLAQGACRHK